VVELAEGFGGAEVGLEGLNVDWLLASGGLGPLFHFAGFGSGAGFGGAEWFRLGAQGTGGDGQDVLQTPLLEVRLLALTSEVSGDFLVVRAGLGEAGTDLLDDLRDAGAGDVETFSGLSMREVLDGDHFEDAEVAVGGIGFGTRGEGVKAVSGGGGAEGFDSGGGGHGQDSGKGLKFSVFSFQ
jgi:hypothetical protein